MEPHELLMNAYRAAPLRALGHPAAALAVLVQLALLAGMVILPLARAGWEVRGDPARRRSARLAFGDSFAGYISFILSTVPEDALVVLPPAEHDNRFGHTGLMQYLLFPRRLTNCPTIAAWNECLENYYEMDTYLISVDGFPLPEIEIASKRYLPFDGRRGLFVPVQAGP
jgi:hypothetical protein